MWNTVNLYDEWFQVDTTWDDPVFSNMELPDYVSYKYFNIPTAQMMQDRTEEPVYSSFDNGVRVTYPSPSCTSTAHTRMIQRSVALTGFDADAVAQEIARSILEQDSAFFAIAGDYTLSAFQSDLYNRYSTVVSKVNAMLPADRKLTSSAYIFTNLSLYDVCGVYLRNM